jgi:hypothetical protein
VAEETAAAPIAAAVAADDDDVRLMETNEAAGDAAVKQLIQVRHTEAAVGGVDGRKSRWRG